MPRPVMIALILTCLLAPLAAIASPVTQEIAVFGIPTEFILFAATLLGVAFFHHHTLPVALTGLTAIVAYKLAFSGFHAGTGLTGLAGHLVGEWVILANLLGLLLGFALLARHFEDSGVPQILPRYLPDGWLGGFALLVAIFVLSSFLDNIAAALIGGTVAFTVFQRRVHIGYLAAIVAASNAGGSGSVVGDTTTTMMWISGIAPLEVFHAYVAAGVALVIFGIPAALQQHRFSPIVCDVPEGSRIDWPRLGIVAWILIAAVATNIVMNFGFKDLANAFPVLGIAVWVAILLAARLRKPEWSLLPEAIKGSLFLLTLVVCASMMPVERLPEASWYSAFTLGFVSAVFDNIPLTALAIEQGGFDWGMLAYAVGFGGSMIWFGSSAGVALSNLYPQAKSVGSWLRHGWHVAVAYVVGFAALMLTLGWQPHVAPSAATPAASAMHGQPSTVQLETMPQVNQETNR
ncbi:citrate transporter [uncultured Thiocystis sp.]|jgi:Na+/H+ antiporter NhaD/arsenite permease-like protein|uniref:citrate transporter n=1 Tax=uncultured Thiocystis sp. TaxID=1202134 RepID=UPI0025D65875|nr:citrate transporter [uncultured Thiocystis sp.]